MAKKLLSMKAYSHHRAALGLPGTTLHAVQKAVQVGRISTVDGKIDPEVGDREWAANTKPPDGAVSDDAESFIDARARKETALADLAEMEAAEMRGEMCFTKDVAQCWGEMVTAMRARGLVFPAMVAPLIAPAGKTAEVQAVLRKYMNEILEELSGDGVPKAVKGRQKRRAEDTEATA